MPVVPARGASERSVEVHQLADGADDLIPLARVDGEARGVVAPVLEASEPFDEDRTQFFGPTYAMIPHMSLVS